MRRTRQFALEAWKIQDTYIYTPHLNSPWNTDADIEIAFEKVFGGVKRDAHALVLDADLALLRRVDIMVMMDNWKDSKGAIMEHDCAKKHGIPIVYGMAELKKYMKSKHRHCAICNRLRKGLQKVHNTRICKDCQPVVAEIVNWELNKDSAKFIKIPKHP